MQFNYYVSLTVGLLLFVLPTFAKDTWVHKESIKLTHRQDLVKGSRAVQSLFHTVVFVRKQKNLDKLEAILHSVSDPTSPHYGKYLTKKEVAQITAYPQAVTEIEKYLKRHDIHNITSSKYEDYITASAPVRKWESIFKSKFYEFRHKLANKEPFIRSLQYSIHHSLIKHVDAVLNTVQLPTPHVEVRPLAEGQEPLNDPFAAFNFVTPSFLRSFYNIHNTTGNNLTSQGIYGALEQTVNPADLSLFQRIFRIPEQPLGVGPGGHVSADACSASIGYCMEANLDSQYITAIGQGVPTTYYYWTGLDIWLGWITTAANMEHPPDVFSISYGSYELFFSQIYLDAFNVEAMKLAVVGTTLLTASGDDGVAGFVARMLGVAFCGYMPMFPASSPYVTTVGGTMGPEEGKPEVTCSTDAGGWITTGGGFSFAFPVQPWQAQQVSAYTDGFELGRAKPQVGYALGKRGYPDVAALADKYIIAANGLFFQISGTSASCPVVAGMVSLVNSARRAAGQPTLGFLNPALYALHGQFVNDITEGENRCVAAGAQCCSEGFFSTPGWDPVTGLGSIDFDKFLKTMMDIPSAATVGGDSAWALAIVADDVPELEASEVHHVRGWSLNWWSIFQYLCIGWLIIAVLLLLGMLMFKFMYRSSYTVLP